MQKTYLFRLFRHSKAGFLFVAGFIIFYSIVFTKKMDMMFFPYNNMYAIDFYHSSVATTYGMKINGQLVAFTKNLYWKKDLLETSLNAFCRYLEHDNKVFMDDYIASKFKGSKQAFLLRQLTPSRESANNWPYWFANAAGYDLKPGDGIEFVEYRFNMADGRALCTDSSVIFKTNWR